MWEPASERVQSEHGSPVPQRDGHRCRVHFDPLNSLNAVIGKKCSKMQRIIYLILAANSCAGAVIGVRDSDPDGSEHQKYFGRWFNSRLGEALCVRGKRIMYIKYLIHIAALCWKK